MGGEPAHTVHNGKQRRTRSAHGPIEQVGLFGKVHGRTPDGRDWPIRID